MTVFNTSITQLLTFSYSHYLRIIQSYKVNGKSKHKTLHSLGKVEDYSVNQLESIAKKLIELAHGNIQTLFEAGIQELGRYNYGYALITRLLWNMFNFESLIKVINLPIG